MFIYFSCLPLDISQNRLDVAKQMGADQTVLIESRDARAVAKNIVETMATEPDVTIECSGAESSIQSAIYVWFVDLYVNLLNHNVK